MKQMKRVRKVGDSFMVNLDREIMQKMKIKEGNLIEMEIINIIDIENKIRDYCCKACDLEFHSDDVKPYCPVCPDGTKVEEIVE